MKKYILSLLVVCWGVLMFGTVVFAGEVVWEDIGDGYRNIRSILVNDKKPQNLYFGSGQGVFSSTDAGESWNNVFSLKGENREVNAMSYGFNDKYSIYAATGNGLFFSLDQAKTWVRIFQGKSWLEKKCRALAIIGDYIYLGTEAGLFVSFDRGKNWKRQSGILGYSRVLSIAFNKKPGPEVYVACVEGLFKTQNNSQSWNKIFSASATENDLNIEEQSELQDEEEKSSAIRFVIIDPENNDRVYLATSSGVFQSDNSGQTWQRLAAQGLLEKEVRAIGVSPGAQLYCATRTGIFLFRGNNWQGLSVRLISGEINSFSLDSLGNLYVASNQGLFKANSNVLTGEGEVGYNAKQDFLNDGLSIAEVQLAAMRFAEVEPEKIKNWRRLAAQKAWFPKMTLGANRATTDLWHWESGSTTKDCDDNLRKGRDSVEWDINFSWDLGNIVWSDDQNSIDVRSRLTVQLRNDILDEVTKIHFERIRVKSELQNLDILDKKKRQEKELRILEFNAYLDGFTGGYFSRNIKSSSG